MVLGDCVWVMEDLDGFWWTRERLKISFQGAGILSGGTRNVLWGLKMNLGTTGLDLGGQCWFEGVPPPRLLLL